MSDTPTPSAPQESDARYWCNARHDMGGGLSYVCTRAKGHLGDHMAHDGRNQLLKSWPNPAPRPWGVHAEEPDL